MRAPRGNPDHSDDVRGAGAEPVVCDLERAGEGEVTEAVGSVDAVVLAAGARTRQWPRAQGDQGLRRGGQAAHRRQANGITRYVLVSAISADPSAGGGRHLQRLQARQGTRRAWSESLTCHHGGAPSGPASHEGRLRKARCRA